MRTCLQLGWLCHWCVDACWQESLRNSQETHGMRLRVSAERVSCSLSDGSGRVGCSWVGVLAPLHGSACHAASSLSVLCPAAAAGTLAGRGNCARQREPFMTSREGVSSARAWPGQGLHFSSPVGEKLKLSAYSCYFLLQLCLRPVECG